MKVEHVIDYGQFPKSKTFHKYLSDEPTDWTQIKDPITVFMILRNEKKDRKKEGGDDSEG